MLKILRSFNLISLNTGGSLGSKGKILIAVLHSTTGTSSATARAAEERLRLAQPRVQ